MMFHSVSIVAFPIANIHIFPGGGGNIFTSIFSHTAIFFRKAPIITVSEGAISLFKDTITHIQGVIVRFEGATHATPLYAMRQNLIRDSASMIVVSRVAIGDG